MKYEVLARDFEPSGVFESASVGPSVQLRFLFPSVTPRSPRSVTRHQAQPLVQPKGHFIQQELTVICSVATAAQNDGQAIVSALFFAASERSVCGYDDSRRVLT